MSPSPLARWWSVGLAVAGLLLGLAFAWLNRPAPPTPPPPPTNAAPAEAPPLPSAPVAALPPAGALATARPRPGEIAQRPPEASELVPGAPRSPLADALGAAGTAPEAEPAVVLRVLDAYRRQVGTYPAGEDHRQMVHALRGRNPAGLPFLPGDHPRLSPAGELLDAWGRPFFFHLVSSTVIQVRSAGPDGEFYTADDLLAGTPVPGR